MVANSKYSGRVFIKTILGLPDGGVGLIVQKVRVGGWVKTGRVMGKSTSAFLEVNDGSCIGNLQLLVDGKVATDSQITQIETSVLVEGELKEPPEDKKQKAELLVEIILHVVNTTRHALAMATHIFFDMNGFMWVHTPIITTMTAKLQVKCSKLRLSAVRQKGEIGNLPPTLEAEVKASKTVVAEKGEILKDLKAEKKTKKEIEPAVQELMKAKEHAARLKNLLS